MTVQAFFKITSRAELDSVIRQATNPVVLQFSTAG